jgi:hypothetical protein
MRRRGNALPCLKTKAAPLEALCSHLLKPNRKGTIPIEPNRKEPVSIGSANFPANNQLTFAPSEYEKVPKPINKIKEYNMSRDTCHVPSAAEGESISTPKD